MTYNLKSIREDFKNKGIFYTPPELAEMLKNYVNFEPKEIYDPTCGDGALLNVFGDNVKKYGQEINAEQLEVAKQRLKNFTGYCGDTLKDPAFIDKKFDCILANPPFSIKWEPYNDIRFKDCPELPPPSKADYAFLLHVLYYLKDDGIAVTLNFPGILYRGNKEGKIRKWMVDNNYIERIVNIPPNTFVDTKINTVLIIFKKNKTTTNIIFEDKELKQERTVALQEIQQNDYNLSVNQYIHKEEVKENINPIELENDARQSMLNKLEKDIKVDLMICEFEKIDINSYLDDLVDVINKYRR